MTLVEKKTDYYIAIKIPFKDSSSVKTAMEVLREEYGEDKIPRYLRPLLLTTGANLRILKALRNGVFIFTLLIRIHLGKELRTSATIDCFADMFLRESPLRIIPMNRLCGLLMK